MAEFVLDDTAVVTPMGYQGAAQHTYTSTCDGFHEPGQCPRSDPHPSHLGHTVLLPAGMVIDGAVVELAQHPDGLITADVRIPARQP